MPQTNLILIFYLFWWASRIRGCFRRWPQPLLRGPEWFFNVAVQAGFYDGAGKTILLHYRMRMLIPFALDIPIVLAMLHPAHPTYFVGLLLAQAALIHLNHVYSVDIAEREARRFAVPEDEQPATAVSLSLQPRRLRDYTNPRLEWGLALSTLAAFLWLLRDYFAAPDHHDLRYVFSFPILYLYAQLGLLFVKRVIVAWRTPVPQTQMAEHMQVREETRKYYLMMCDWNRVVVAAATLSWPIMLSASPAGVDRLRNIWVAIWVMSTLGLGVWVEVKRRQLLAMALRARPVQLPDFLQQSEIAKWPVCYQPSAPMLVLKGARGYSLNLANTLAQFGAAYLAGWVALFAFLRVGH
jgi:hypothetical protein